MPSFDFERNCYVVRIVYDGPGLAGKTTNLTQICNMIPNKRRSSMVTPAALKGRTMFFDWLELLGPDQEDAPLRFHLISVPGQEARNYRRRPLVEAADVVVFVGDSTPEGLNDTRRSYARLKVSMRRRSGHLPLVVQANKQDVEGATPLKVLRRKLGLDGDVPMVGASAIDGRGVRRTLTQAMRLGVSCIQQDEVAPQLPELADPDALFDHVLAFEVPSVDEAPIEVEELNLNENESELSQDLADRHLYVSSLDALEEKARRAAERRQSEEPEADEQKNARMA
jgi:signal recognition particle receptor subunit beta